MTSNPNKQTVLRSAAEGNLSVGKESKFQSRRWSKRCSQLRTLRRSLGWKKTTCKVGTWSKNYKKMLSKARRISTSKAFLSFFVKKKTSASASYTPQEAAWSGAGTLTASRKHTGFISHPLPHTFCRAYERQGGGTVTVFKEEYGCHMN